MKSPSWTIFIFTQRLEGAKNSGVKEVEKTFQKTQGLCCFAYLSPLREVFFRHTKAKRGNIREKEEFLCRKKPTI